ncbi:hypothetical protein G6F57_017847 [Rhizopus arrhizus]|nr:hypothetical protein G6F57_017847 [Rhizopus arrhizus]
MPVDLAVGRFEQGFLVAGAAGRDIGGAHDPDAQAFIAAGIDVTGVVDRHFGVRCVQAADVLVRQAVLAADEHFPQRPVFAHDGYPWNAGRAPRALICNGWKNEPENSAIEAPARPRGAGLAGSQRRPFEGAARSASGSSSSGSLALRLLVRVGNERVAHPGAVLVRLDARGQAFPVQRADDLQPPFAAQVFVVRLVRHDGEIDLATGHVGDQRRAAAVRDVRQRDTGAFGPRGGDQVDHRPSAA